MDHFFQIFDGPGGTFDAIDGTGLHLHGQHNLMGGTDLTSNGFVVDHSQANALGGADHFTDGHLTASTHENALGGVDVFDATGHALGHTQEGLDHSTSFFSRDGQFLGKVTPALSEFHAKFFKL